MFEIAYSVNGMNRGDIVELIDWSAGNGQDDCIIEKNGVEYVVPATAVHVKES